MRRTLIALAVAALPACNDEHTALLEAGADAGTGADRADAFEPHSVICALVYEYRYEFHGAELAFAYDDTTLSPPRTFTRRRTFTADPGPTAPPCSTEIETCGPADLDTGDVAAALAHPDVLAAFAAARDTSSFGRSRRSAVAGHHALGRTPAADWGCWLQQRRSRLPRGPTRSEPAADRAAETRRAGDEEAELPGLRKVGETGPSPRARLRCRPRSARLLGVNDCAAPVVELRPAPRARPAADDPAAALARLERLAFVLDRRFLDLVLGLVVPGVGDLVGAAAGLYAVAVALRLRAPKVVVARMLLNLSVDSVGGAVPVVGDVWDFLFRANTRNVELLRARLAQGEGGAPRSSARDWLAVGGAAAVFLLALAAPVFLVIAVVKGLR